MHSSPVIYAPLKGSPSAANADFTWLFLQEPANERNLRNTASRLAIWLLTRTAPDVPEDKAPLHAQLLFHHLTDRLTCDDDCQGLVSAFRQVLPKTFKTIDSDLDPDISRSHFLYSLAQTIRKARLQTARMSLTKKNSLESALGAVNEYLGKGLMSVSFALLTTHDLTSRHPETTLDFIDHTLQNPANTRLFQNHPSPIAHEFMTHGAPDVANDGAFAFAQILFRRLISPATTEEQSISLVAALRIVIPKAHKAIVGDLDMAPGAFARSIAGSDMIVLSGKEDPIKQIAIASAVEVIHAHTDAKTYIGIFSRCPRTRQRLHESRLG